MLRAKVMVLEERMKGYSEAVRRIFDTLQRIEEKLDDKAGK
jgi:glutathionyl-hydroquinone reductase